MKTTITLHEGSKKLWKKTIPNFNIVCRILSHLFIVFLSFYAIKKIKVFLEYHKQLETASAGVLPLCMCILSVTFL